MAPKCDYVGLAHPGNRARTIGHLLRASVFITLAVLGFVPGLPFFQDLFGHKNSAENSMNEANLGYNGTIPIRQLGADPIPELRFPKPILSSVYNMVSMSGAVSNTSQNVTLYNSGISMRLLGSPSPHDVLLGDQGRILSSYSFWIAQIWLNGSWASLAPLSNSFILLGTNSTGTFIIRTMQTERAGYSAKLRITYVAEPTGPLNWSLEFDPVTSGQYRLIHVWRNVTKFQMLSATRQFTAGFGGKNYTLSWNDVSASYTTLASETQGQFVLSITLGSLTAGSSTLVDPTLVATSNSAYATAWSFQRHVFYEPKWGNYFVFYNKGGNTFYRYSHDGINWSSDQPLPVGWPAFVDNPTSSVAVFSSNQQVVIATGDKATTNSSATVYLRYSIGTISGYNITWGSIRQAVIITRSASSGTITLGIRYVNLVVTSSGMIAFSYNWYTSGTGTGVCTQSSGGISSEVGVFVTYNGNTIMSSCYSNIAGSDSHQDRSIIVPSSSNGQVRDVYQFHTSKGVQLFSRTLEINGTGGPLEIVDSTYMTDTDEFSATTDANYGTNLVYQNGQDENLTYAYRSPKGQTWTYLKDVIYPSLPYQTYPLYYDWPAITIDYSTNDLYVFAADTFNKQVVMREKDSAGTWQRGINIIADTSGIGPMFLGSNLVSASGTNVTTISLVWTVYAGGIYNVTFASIPISTLWSPYSSPSDPWDGNGLAPYAQYFSNLGEYVSPASGMLTVRETDLAVPGRGLSLDITRVYTEPEVFQKGSPFGYESYSSAPMGNGWQLNFPWMLSSSNATYLHLWDGQGYRVSPSFWSGQTATYLNDQGELFRLARDSDGSIALTSSDGTSYNFDSSHKLTNMTDAVGTNSIVFSYDTNNHVSKITDTLGRTFLFCYSNGLLHSINQTSSTSTCSSNGSVRGLVFGYNNYNDLVNFTDPAARVTSYSYDSTHWLITKIAYPTTWYDSYSYATFLSGTEADIFRVNWQEVNATQGIPIRSFQYNYFVGASGQVYNSTVASYDARSSQPTSYNLYTFSSGGVQWNITDSSRSLVRGELERFNSRGEVASETTILTDRSGLNWPPGSYTNYYSYDSWGNVIYSRNTIFSKSIEPYDPPPWYHETFYSYYNNGVPPGFYSFAETFNSNQATATDNLWHTNGGSWVVNKGNYNGTYINGALFDTFAWTNSSSSDISLQARVYISQQLTTSAIIGIFVHYPGSGYGKWSLIVNTDTKNAYFNDDSGSWGSPGGACALVTGAWVTFSFTIHGLTATGSVSQDRNPGCPGSMISGTFPASSSVATATNFGLMTGGFSALFANVTATTVSPLITTTGFSNSFFGKGAPNANIHRAIAGTAELQNGTASAPIETYYSYYTWGGLNQTKQLYAPQGGSSRWITTSRSYDAYGNLVLLVDPRGNSTSYNYSTKYLGAYLTRETLTLIPGFTQITYSYGYNLTIGTKTWSQEPNGYGTNLYNTTFRYDILGRLTKITYPTGDTTVYSYNDKGNYVDITNENGQHTRQIYDGLGRLSVTESFLGSLSYNQSYAYNWQNKVASQTDQIGRVSMFSYDPLGRLTQATEPNGNFTQILYNDVRGWERHIDENNAGPGTWTFYTYDRSGRLIEVDDPPTATSGVNSGLYYYDEIGNLRKTCINSCAQLNSQTSYAYDDLNRLTQTLYQDNTTELYSYDNNGNVVVKTDRMGSQTSESYDSLNRPITTIYRGSPSSNATYTYDLDGNTYQTNNPNSTITYLYDSRNRLVQEDYYEQLSPNYALFAVNYTYKGEMLSQISYPDNLHVNFTYDALGRITSAYSPRGTTYATLAYYPTSQIKSIVYGNGLYSNYTYDNNSRPSTITLTQTGKKGSTLLSLTYAYNKTGNVVSVSGQSNGIALNEHYAYDNLQRLTNASLTTGSTQTSLSYSYDTLGNMLWQKQNGQKTSYSYNVNNSEQTSASNGSTSIVDSYDADGNLLTKNVTSTGTVHWRYTWDPSGRLVKATNDNGVQGVYAYDADGRLVGSREGSTTTFYAYLGTETLYQSIVGSSSTDYVFAGGTRIAKVSGVTVNYYHSDAEGNTRLVTSSTGTVVFSDNYLPYGLDNGTLTGSETYKFIGKPWSGAIGLYYDYQRWYDPSTGRFVSQDPGDGRLDSPQSLNKYSYALNNPLGLVDVDGAGPVDTTWLKVFVGFYSAITRSHSVTSILRIPIPPEKWGNWFVGKANDHTIWSAGRPKYPGIRSESELIGKLDRPDLGSSSPMQWFYHRIEGADETHVRMSDSWGKASDAFFKLGPDLSKGMLVAGLIVSAINVVSAYQQGERQGDIALTQEAFSWAGAIGGAELGATIGTALFPGVGTVIGGIVGGVGGGLGGGAFGDWVGNQLFDSPFPGYIYYPTPTFGKYHANPI